MEAVLCTLAVGLMLDPDALVLAMVTMVHPGGQMLIGDGRLKGHWYGPLLNPLLRRTARPGVPTALSRQYRYVRQWESLKALSEDFHHEEWLGGILYVARGRRRASVL